MAQKVVYSDLDSNLLLTELRDISIVINQEAVRESIENILLTYEGERLMRPDFGSQVQEYLFENIIEDDTLAFLEMEIRNSIEQWEDRVVLNRVRITRDSNNSRRLNVLIFFTLVVTGEQVDVEIPLSTQEG